MTVLAYELNLDGTQGDFVKITERDAVPGYVWCVPIHGEKTPRRRDMRRLVPEGFSASIMFERMKERKAEALAAQLAFSEAFNKVPRLSAYDVKELPERKNKA